MAHDSSGGRSAGQLQPPLQLQRLPELNGPWTQTDLMRLADMVSFASRTARCILLAGAVFLLSSGSVSSSGNYRPLAGDETRGDTGSMESSGSRAGAGAIMSGIKCLAGAGT